MIQRMHPLWTRTYTCPGCTHTEPPPPSLDDEPARRSTHLPATVLSTNEHPDIRHPHSVYNTHSANRHQSLCNSLSMPTVINCETCGKSIVKGNLNRHMKEVQCDGQDKDICRYCNYTSRRPADFRRHLAGHYHSGKDDAMFARATPSTSQVPAAKTPTTATKKRKCPETATSIQPVKDQVNHTSWKKNTEGAIETPTDTAYPSHIRKTPSPEGDSSGDSSSDSSSNDSDSSSSASDKSSPHKKKTPLLLQNANPVTTKPDEHQPD